MNLPVQRTEHVIPEMSLTTIDQVRRYEEVAKGLPQEIAVIEQTIHAGVYARTLRMPAQQVLTGALIQIPTILIVSGNCRIFTGGETKHLIGYHVLQAEKNRKQLIVSVEDTNITMLFATQAKNVKDAEEEFTCEYRQLTTRTLVEV